MDADWGSSAVLAVIITAANWIITRDRRSMVSEQPFTALLLFLCVAAGLTLLIHVSLEATRC